jgi:hypothetical protein
VFKVEVHSEVPPLPVATIFVHRRLRQEILFRNPTRSLADLKRHGHGATALMTSPHQTEPQSQLLPR